MKLETFILATVALAYIIAGFCTNVISGLSQWLNSGEWPPRINWVGIVIMGVLGAASNYLAFVSGRFHEYMQKRNGNTQIMTKQ